MSGLEDTDDLWQRLRPRYVVTSSGSSPAPPCHTGTGGRTMMTRRTTGSPPDSPRCRTPGYLRSDSDGRNDDVAQVDHRHVHSVDHVSGPRSRTWSLRRGDTRSSPSGATCSSSTWRWPRRNVPPPVADTRSCSGQVDVTRFCYDFVEISRNTARTEK